MKNCGSYPGKKRYPLHEQQHHLHEYCHFCLKRATMSVSSYQIEYVKKTIMALTPQICYGIIRADFLCLASRYPVISLHTWQLSLSGLPITLRKGVTVFFRWNSCNRACSRVLWVKKTAFFDNPQICQTQSGLFTPLSSPTQEFTENEGWKWGMWRQRKRSENCGLILNSDDMLYRHYAKLCQHLYVSYDTQSNVSVHIPPDKFRHAWMGTRRAGRETGNRPKGIPAQCPDYGSVDRALSHHHRSGVD